MIKKEVGSYTEKVLKTAIDQGVVVLIATGRPVFGVPDVCVVFLE